MGTAAPWEAKRLSSFTDRPETCPQALAPHEKVAVRRNEQGVEFDLVVRRH